MIAVTEGWLNERAENRNRGRIMSIYMITTYACAGSAQLIMMLGSPDGFRLFVIVSILYSFALIPILMTQSKTPMLPKPHRPNIRRLYKLSPVSMAGSFVVGYVNSVFYALTPVYAYNLRLTTEQTAIFIAVSITSGMLLQLPLGRLSDRIDRRWVIILSCLLTSPACYFLFISDGKNISSLYFVGIFYGSIAFSIHPVCMAHINDLTPENERTQTAGGLLMSYGIGAILGPVIAGFVISFGANYIYMMSGISTFIFTLHALTRLKIKIRRTQEKHEFKAFSVQNPARKLIFSNKASSKKTINNN